MLPGNQHCSTLPQPEFILLIMRLAHLALQGFEMAGGMLYRSFLKTILPDLFSTLPNLTHWHLRQLSLNLREGPRCLASPLPTVSWCPWGDLWAELLSPVLTMGSELGTWFDSLIPVKLVGAGLPLTTGSFPGRQPSGAASLWGRSQVGSPHLGMSSTCLPGRILLINVLQGAHIMHHFELSGSFLMIFCGGQAGNVSLFFLLLTGQVWRGGACL